MPIYEDKNFKDYVNSLPAATENDLSAGNNMPIVSASDVKKMGGENVAGKTEVITGVRIFSSDSLTSYKGIPRADRAAWYTATGRHVAIPVNPGDTFIIEPSVLNSNYVVFNSDYVPGNQVLDSALPLASNFSFRHTAGGPVTITMSGDDAYLVLVVVDGGGTTVNWNVKQLTSNNTRSEIADVVQVAITGVKKMSNTDFFYYFGALGSGAWYDVNRKTAHIEIPLQPGIAVKITPSKSARCMIFGSGYSQGDKTTGESFGDTSHSPFVINSTYIVVPSTNDAWLILTTVDGAFSSVEWDIELFNVAAVECEEITLDIANFTKYSGVPSDANTWFVGSGAKHIAIPLSSGDCYKFKSIGLPLNYVVVTSDYTPGTQTHGTDVPISSRNFKRSYLPADCDMIITAHADDAYLILPVVDGGGYILTLDLKKVLNYQSQDVRKIRYAHWNIGGFSMGKSTSTSIPEEEAAEKQAAYRSLLNSISADFLGIAEDTREFSLGGTRSYEAVYSCFVNASFGSKNAHNSNSIYNNMKLAKDDYYFVFENKRQFRYIHEQEYIWNGKSVIVAETHLDFTDWTDDQIAAVISRYADKEYVIISADWNANSDSQYEPFKAAGYKMAFLDYMPHVATYSDVCIDNVMVKGFAISNAHLIDASSALSDHKMVVCDLTMV